MKKPNSEVTALIPGYWDLTAKTIEDIVFLGKTTIREMIRSWRSQAQALSSSIKEADENLKFMQDKNATSIQKLAKKSENPTFPHVGVGVGSLTGDKEPLDAASINRKREATTFNVCGWCKYAAGGACRYSFHISTTCSLITDAGIQDEERHFDTPCVFKKAPDEFFNSIRSGLEEQRQKLIEEKRLTDRKIKLLLRLEDLAEKKPVFSNQRPHDWFNVNDDVICYVGNREEWICSDQFATAKIIPGYRHHDGCVSVRFDKRVHANPFLEGHGAGYGMSRPEVMHLWEFEYLLEHPDFAKLWATKGVSPELEDYDSGLFLLVLSQEMMRRSIKKGETVLAKSAKTT
jgi:hypothetical protein